MGMQEVIDEAVAATPEVRWSIRVGEDGAYDADRQLRTASIGKLLLLLQTARGLEDGTLDAAEPLRRDPALAVADSGLWQHLAVDALPLADVAVLIAAVSDNWATNVLLQRIGLDAVAALAGTLGLRDTGLHDRVRGHREPTDPATLSTGSAGELSGLMAGLARGELVSAAVSRRMDAWMATSVDLSMVASGTDLDPLAHVGAERGLLLRNKTGTDTGIRADVGHLGDLPYAVLANWDARRHDATDAVMAAMRGIGAALARAARR